MSTKHSQPPQSKLRFADLVDDPELRQAALEVDRTLIDWSLKRTLRQRLDACTNATRALARFKHVPSKTG